MSNQTTDKMERMLVNIENARLLKENARLRVAMDYLLRSPAGFVPSEADEFYDFNRATFQPESEALKK